MLEKKKKMQKKSTHDNITKQPLYLSGKL